MMPCVVEQNNPGEVVREALAQAAVDNAERLLRDASILLDAGSAATAHSLAVLALEEVGKAVICYRLGGDDEQSMTRAEFLREIRSHTAKLQRVRNLLDLMEAFVSLAQDPLADSSPMAASEEGYRTRLIQKANDDHVRKLRGFYVDLGASDLVELPSDVTNAEAQEVLELARWVAKIARELVLDGTVFG